MNRGEIKRLKGMVTAEVDKLAEYLIALSDRIHANPEIRFQETKAAAWLVASLAEAGFTVEQGVAGLPTAFRAEREGQPGGPTIAFLAEYDALPELGHACGHNIIGTASIGAALALNRALPELVGRLVVLGTPGEEGGGGKVIMVEAGVFQGIDAAMLVHPARRNVVDSGSQAREALEFRFRGKAAHAAGSPHEGINALEAVLQTFNGVNALRQHIKSEACIHGIITHGGAAANIVPEYAAMQIYVRAADKKYLQEVVEKVKNCAAGGALMTGATLEISRFAEPYDNMLPNPVLAERYTAQMAELGLTAEAGRDSDSKGSTDMGNVSQVVPSLHPYIAIAPQHVPGHTREFAVVCASEAGHRGLLLAAKSMAMTAVELLAEPDLLRQVKEAFLQQTQG